MRPRLDTSIITALVKPWTREQHERKVSNSEIFGIIRDRELFIECRILELSPESEVL